MSDAPLTILEDRRFVEDPVEPFFWADFLVQRAGDPEPTQILMRIAVADFRGLQERLGWDDTKENNALVCEQILRAAIARGFWSQKLEAREHWELVERVVEALVATQ